MNPRRFAFVLLGLLAACARTAVSDTDGSAGGDTPTAARVGDTCADSSSCGGGLECVATFSDANTCLPQPRERAPRRCSVDDDCRRSDGEQWPIEADCLDGACHCNDVDKSCNEFCGTDDDCPLSSTGRPFVCEGGRCVGDNDSDLVLDAVTCLCVQRGGVGDRCNTAATCSQFPALACSGGRCVSGAPAGASCALGSGEACANGACAGAADDGLGVCP